MHLTKTLHQVLSCRLLFAAKQVLESLQIIIFELLEPSLVVSGVKIVILGWWFWFWCGLLV